MLPGVRDRLQEIAAITQCRAGSTLDLPQIAVVGGQSSGKSSVLEAIVGRRWATPPPSQPSEASEHRLGVERR